MEITRIPSDPGCALGLSRDEVPINAALTQSMEDLEQRIATRTDGRIRDLRIETVGDAVVLSGRTSTYYMKQLATQIALDEPCEFSTFNLTLQNRIDVV